MNVISKSAVSEQPSDAETFICTDVAAPCASVLAKDALSSVAVTPCPDFCTNEALKPVSGTPSLFFGDGLRTVISFENWEFSVATNFSEEGVETRPQTCTDVAAPVPNIFSYPNAWIDHSPASPVNGVNMALYAPFSSVSTNTISSA